MTGRVHVSLSQEQTTESNYQTRKQSAERIGEAAAARGGQLTPKMEPHGDGGPTSGGDGAGGGLRQRRRWLPSVWWRRQRGEVGSGRTSDVRS